MKNGIPALLALLVALCLPRTDADAAELVMLEQTACYWCEVWDEEIAAIYPKTESGQRAPLRRIDLHSPKPDDLKHIEFGRFTPTFVLIDEGREVGRIRGYPGEDFFWGLLDQMVAELPAENPSAAAGG